MQFKKSLALASLSAMASQAAAGFNIDSKDNLVLYWGQASAGSQQTLGDYCSQTAGDVYVLSFMNEFNANSYGLNFAGNCDSTTSCPDIGNDIKTCQDQGKLVLLSMGGAVGQYGFTSDSDGEQFAQIMWDDFAGGSSSSRPFGDAVIDGFDLDIENGNSAGYAALVTKFKQLADGASKSYYVSAAPQCVYPDANVGNALANSDIDMAFIQFYNNPCALDKSFNWDQWQDFAQNTSPNKNIKLYVGLPASSSAAGSGFVDQSTVSSTISSISSSNNFGGIMLWDASQAFSAQGGSNYADEMQSILNGISGGSSSSGSSSSGSSSAGSSAAVTSSAAPAATNNVVAVAQEPSSSDGGVVFVTHYVSQTAYVQATVTVDAGSTPTGNAKRDFVPAVVRRHQN